MATPDFSSITTKAQFDAAAKAANPFAPQTFNLLTGVAEFNTVAAGKTKDDVANYYALNKYGSDRGFIDLNAGGGSFVKQVAKTVVNPVTVAAVGGIVASQFLAPAAAATGGIGGVAPVASAASVSAAPGFTAVGTAGATTVGSAGIGAGAAGITAAAAAPSAAATVTGYAAATTGVLGAAGSLIKAGKSIAGNVSKAAAPLLGNDPSGGVGGSVTVNAPTPAQALQVAQDGNTLNMISIVVGIAGILAAVYFARTK